MKEFDRNTDNALSLNEIHTMQGELAHTPRGQATTKLEFGLLVALFSDTTVMENGEKVPALTRKALEKFYDGSLFREALTPGNQVTLNKGLFLRELGSGLASAAGTFIEEKLEAMGWKGQ